MMRRNLALPILFAAAACTGSKAGGKGSAQNLPPQLLQTGTFRHDQHLALEANGKRLTCSDCHAADPKQQYRLERPGSAEHAPCDSCHLDAFMKAPGPLCMTCHLSVDPTHNKKSPMLPYPRQQGVAELVSRFDHQAHIPRVKERIKQGGQFACEACHTIKDKETALAAFPMHPDCAFCHAEVATPKMSDCMACHAESGPVSGRKFVGNDIRFTHGKHREDKSGKRIDCVTCHHMVPKSSRAADLNLPEMRDCAVCHEDPARTPDRVRITKCGVCHLSDVTRVALPGNHTP
jgi:cytochrome c7-like protein